MDALDVILLSDAKDHLVVEDSFSDTQITRLIKTAIAMVEQYTDYRLYQRPETVISIRPVTELSQFPLIITSVTLSDATPYTDYTSRVGVLSTCVTAPVQSTILLNVGYVDIADIPSPLIDAAYKIITYLYENKDAYEATLPYDIQMMLNQWRRSATI